MADKGEFAQDLRKLSMQQARGYLLQLGLAEPDLTGAYYLPIIFPSRASMPHLCSTQRRAAVRQASAAQQAALNPAAVSAAPAAAMLPG